jgi:hypothetical protein
MSTRFASALGREKRRTERQLFGMPGWIDRGEQFSHLTCHIEDVSMGGARIELASDECLPARFLLFVRGRDHAISCETVWRRGRAVGVKYVR